MVLFGRPDEGERFRDRNQVFFRLEALLNKAFSRGLETEKPADAVVFGLGRIAVEDFLELLLLGRERLRLRRPETAAKLLRVDSHVWLLG
jgi:hypothetical protein